MAALSTPRFFIYSRLLSFTPSFYLPPLPPHRHFSPSSSPLFFPLLFESNQVVGVKWCASTSPCDCPVPESIHLSHLQSLTGLQFRYSRLGWKRPLAALLLPRNPPTSPSSSSSHPRLFIGYWSRSRVSLRQHRVRSFL